MKLMGATALAAAVVATAFVVDAGPASAVDAVAPASARASVVPDTRGYGDEIPFKRLPNKYRLGRDVRAVGVNRYTVVPIRVSARPDIGAIRAAAAQTAAFWAREIPGMRLKFRFRPTIRRPARVACDAGNAWAAALSARRPVRLGFRRHLLVVAPECGDGWGYGSMGPGSGRAYSAGIDAFVMAHEIGHNFGLPHANKLDCTGAGGGATTLSSSCREYEYLDGWVVMGGRHSPSLGDFRAGPIGQARLTRGVRRVRAGRESTLVLSNAGASGRRAAVVRTGHGPLFFDATPSAWFGPGDQTGGVQARLGTRGGSGLLTLPDPAGQMGVLADSVLEAGESWQIPGAALRIEVLETTATRATVRFVPTG